MAKPPTTCEDIIRVWKELDAKSDKPIGADKVAAAMGISPFWISKLFVGKSLTDMKRQHGIRISRQEAPRSDDELFSELDAMVSKHSCIPPWNILNHETGMAEGTWKKRLGGNRGCSQEEVYRRYGEWLRIKKPDSPNLRIVRDFLQGPLEPTKTPDTGRAPTSRRTQVPKYQKADRREFGPPLHFGNLTYEPTNEQGVVFLFGMVSKALGFESVEYLGTDFPDCEAKWRVPNGRLQHVRIEFEFRSRSYDHPTDGCDVIVCWEDNWKKDCPLPVIELKKEIKRLKDGHN
jgi:hypothetical protein